MIGRRVIAGYHQKAGEVIRWEPLSTAMCDALVRHDDGTECWYASYALKPTDGKGPLPDREQAREAARRNALAILREIRAQHVRDFHERWPGMEFAKAHVGQMIDGAIAALEGKNRK